SARTRRFSLMVGAAPAYSSALCHSEPEPEGSRCGSEESRGRRMSSVDLQQQRKEQARCNILRVLDAGRPIGASEHMIWQVLKGVKIPFSANELRREVD